MIRKANMGDVVQIHRLINLYAKLDLMLPRSLNELYENLRDFWVYEDKEKVLGCCALHIEWAELVEIKCLAVSKNYQRRGVGRRLLEVCLEEAKSLGAKKVFVLSYNPDYFQRFGFRRIERSKLPHKIWAECIRCAKFPDCKETALIKKIKPGRKK